MDGVTARLFRLVELLSGQGHQMVRELADRLEVSERTIRRDLGRLQELDIQVVARPGRHGGVQLEPGTLLFPLRFTDSELLALVLGIRQLGRFADDTLQLAAARALQRLEAVLSDSAREQVASLSHALPWNPSQESAATRTESERIFELAGAIRQQRRIQIRYTSPAGGATTREVDPYGLTRLGHWYLAAYCHLRQDMRVFRLDRINSLSSTTHSFDRPSGFDAYRTVETALAETPSAGSLTCRVRVHADLNEVGLLVPATVVTLEPDPAGTLLSVRAKPQELRKLALHLLGLPFPLEVLEPPELRAALRAVGKQASALGSEAV